MKKKLSVFPNNKTGIESKVDRGAIAYIRNLLGQISDNASKASTIIDGLDSQEDIISVLGNIRKSLSYLIPNMDILSEIAELFHSQLQGVVPAYFESSLRLIRSYHEAILDRKVIESKTTEDFLSEKFTKDVVRIASWKNDSQQYLAHIQESISELKTMLSEAEKNDDKNDYLKEVDLSATPFLTASHITNAEEMAELYKLLYCFENSVRNFIEMILKEKYGDMWWEKGATDATIRVYNERKSVESKNKWLSPRGSSPLYYLSWGDLVKIIRKNYALFTPHVGEIRFVESRFEDLEKLRNIVAHNGYLSSEEDFQRIILSIKDWQKQMKK